MIMHPKQKVASAFAAEVGKVIRDQREQLGLRQDELALAAGVSTRVIHQIEHGKPTSRLDSVIPVLDALGLAFEIHRQDGARRDEV